MSPPPPACTAAGSQSPFKSPAEYEKYLENEQYSENGVKKYEFIFGKGFISTGGHSTTEKIAPLLQLKENARVLDIGCGIGGGAAYMSEKYKCHVLGVDLTTRCITMAQQRYANNPKLEFLKADAMTMDVPPSTYDVIYSRDAILHIADKAQLFEKFFTWLKPGGRVVISDYSCGEAPLWTQEFSAYLQKRAYHLVTVDAYSALLQKAGFIIEKAQDESKWFTSILKEEIQRLQQNKEEFLKTFTEDDFKDLEDGWKQKIVRIEQGCQTWGIYSAVKPTNPIEK